MKRGIFRLRRGFNLTLGACALLAGVFLPAAAPGHDLWLQPSTYFAARGQDVGVTLVLGEHGQVEETKPLRRADTPRFGRFGARRPTQDLLGDPAFKEGATTSTLSFHAEGGSTLLAMERAPKRLEQGSEEFTRYLTEEGQTEALARRTQTGQVGQPGKERYRRYLKTLVQDTEASSGAAVLYRRRVGQRLEILLENNPGRLRPGQPVRVRVRFENRTLPGVRVTALHRPRPDAPADRTLTATTDPEGRASFPPFDVAGPWLVRLVYVRPAVVGASPPTPTPPGDDVAWESFWAAYSFGVRLLPPVPPVAPAHRRRD